MLSTLVFSALALTAIASPVQRRVAVGTTIYECTVPGTIALTFDDGPSLEGTSILDQLKAYDMKATFFMNGNNFRELESQAAYIQRADAEGHQLASHTESHPHLPLLDTAGVTAEMIKLENRFLGIIGKIPTYMRPPFLETSPAVLSTLGSLGYHVIDIDVDTFDYNQNYPAPIEFFDAGLADGKTLVLMHEVWTETVNILLPHVLAAVKASGKKAVTVGECLGDAPANWYRPSRDAPTTTTTSSAVPTTTSSTTAAATTTSAVVTTTTSAVVTTTTSAVVTTTTSAVVTTSTSAATTTSGAATTTSAAGSASTSAATSTTAAGTTSTGSGYPAASSTHKAGCKPKSRRSLVQ